MLLFWKWVCLWNEYITWLENVSAWSETAYEIDSKCCSQKCAIFFMIFDRIGNIFHLVFFHASTQNKWCNFKIYSLKFKTLNAQKMCYLYSLRVHKSSHILDFIKIHKNYEKSSREKKIKIEKRNENASQLLIRENETWNVINFFSSLFFFNSNKKSF